MRKIFLIFLICNLNSEILMVTDKRELNEDIIKKIGGFFKNERIIISPSNYAHEIDFKPLLIFVFEKKFLINFPERFKDVPCILLYIEDPLIPLSLNITGIFYTVPPWVVFSFLNAIGFKNKKIITIIPEGKIDFSYVEEAKRISSNFNIILNILETKIGNISGISEEIKKGDIIWIFPNEITLNPVFIKYIIRFSLEEKKIIIGYSKDLVEQGFVFSIEVEENKYKDKIYDFVKKISEGKNPLAIPIQYPDNFNYYYNSKIGKLLGLNVDFSKFYKEIKYIEK
jgi:hypothetical protein